MSIKKIAEITGTSPATVSRVLNNPSYIVEGEEEQAALGDIFYILGNAYFEQEDYTNAGACFEQAIAQIESGIPGKMILYP